MLGKFKRTLLTLAALGAIFIGSSRADIETNTIPSQPGWGKGSEGYPTGNNPHHYAVPALVNMTQSSFTSPQKMLKGPIQESFRIAYDFRQSGISFTDTNKYFINFSDNRGDNYGVGRFSTNGTGYLDFYVNGQSLNSSACYLTNGSPMHIAVSDGSNIYGLEKELEYNAQAGVNKTFIYTNSTLGKIIGSKESLKVKSFKENTLVWRGYEGVSYDILSTDDLSKNWATNNFLKCTNNEDCTFSFSLEDKTQFFKIQTKIEE
jgi:hypothetical protein